MSQPTDGHGDDEKQGDGYPVLSLRQGKPVIRPYKEMVCQERAKEAGQEPRSESSIPSAHHDRQVEQHVRRALGQKRSQGSTNQQGYGYRESGDQVPLQPGCGSVGKAGPSPRHKDLLIMLLGLDWCKCYADAARRHPKPTSCCAALVEHGILTPMTVVLNWPQMLKTK